MRITAISALRALRRLAGRRPIGRGALLCALLALLGSASSGRAQPGPAGSFPGLRLAERVEQHLEQQQEILKETPSHYGFVFAVEQADLLERMARIRIFGDSREIVLGTDQGFEAHGGGLLAFLLDHWRPDGRPARLDDRFRFVRSSASIPLVSIYVSHLRQLVLPEAETGREAGLPRMRFGMSGALGQMSPLEVDAYRFLLLLTEHAADLDARWRNHLGQELSVALLLERTRAHYLGSVDSPAEPADHSNLHLVEVLLSRSRRLDDDPDPIKRRFLAVELKRRAFEPADETLLLGHYAESLGMLIADSRLRWSADERRQVRSWLAWLEDGRMRELGNVPPRHLAHLLRGLRLLRVHRARLDPADR